MSQVSNLYLKINKYIYIYTYLTEPPPTTSITLSLISDLLSFSEDPCFRPIKEDITQVLKFIIRMIGQMQQD